MSENTITTYSQTPYNDDFHSVDPATGKTPEQKNYLRILYKPGVSVQARELNQMQSMIQSQIDKFGRGVFSDGASIIEGEKNFDNDVYAIDVNFEVEPGTAIDNLLLIRNDAGLKASIIKAEQLGTSQNDYRLFIRYENTTQIGEEKENVREFAIGAALFTDVDILTSTGSVWANAGPTTMGVITDIKYAAFAKVEPGVFFVKGEFVLSEEQRIYMIKPNRDYLISGKVAFRVIEIIKTSGNDNTLLDNAAGTPNFNAPGADRYSIELELLFISDYDGDPLGEDYTFINDNSSVISDETANQDTNSYSVVLNIVDNNVSNTTNELLSDNFNSILATRTSEESGDYTVKPFVIDVRELLNDINDGDNRGLYTTDQIKTLGIVVEEGDISGVAPNGDVPIISTTSDALVETYAKSRFTVGLEPSVAYVDGYRIAPESKIYIDAEKARETEDNELVYTTARLGNYLEGTEITNLPTFGEEIAFGATTAKIRGLERLGDTFRLYLYDVSGAIPSNVTSGTTGSGFVFTFIAGSKLQETEYTKSIYPLPYDDISNVANVEFTVRGIVNGTANDSNQIEITLIEQGIRFFDEGSGDNYIVVDNNGAKVDIESAVIQSGSNNKTVILNIKQITTPFSNGDKVPVVVSYKKSLSPKPKTSVSLNVTKTGLTNSFVDLDNKVDVYKINSATYIDDTDPQNPVTVNITNDIVLDDGQRDGVYKKSKVRYKGSVDLTDVDVTINYTYFTHTGDGEYYNRNSYQDIAYEDIPFYSGTRLCDALDFRPDEGTYNTAIIDPNSVIEATVSYYLNRVDSVVVNNVGVFSVIKGIPALVPVQPETPENSMLLYVLDIPSYTFDVSDININYVDNRRYTMRDIGEIEKRIKNLEYYTSLSLLEREANEKQIIDGTRDRFKNGILVDSFSGHGTGDALDPGYICSIDSNDGKLRPSFKEDSTRLVLDDVDNNSYGGLATLRYTEEVPFIEQLAASTHMSVNPYAVAAWWGEVKLSPSSDEWKETSQRPDVIINRENDAATLRAIQDATRAQGTIWGSWNTNWTGRIRNPRSRNGGRRLGSGGWCSNIRRNGWCRNHGRLWNTNQSRSGIRTTATVETVREVVNDKIIDTSFVPFIRSRKVYFKGSMFRPDTKINIFFDEVDISSYATKAPFQEFKSSSDVKTYLNDSTPLTTDGVSREELITDGSGNIEGYFIIPNNSAIKFRTGEREVLFTDSSPDDTAATTTATAVYSAKGLIEHKQRTVVSSRRVTVSQERVTQNRNINQPNCRWRLVADRRLACLRQRTRWRDPLAQSFMIGEIETGLYATSIDLYFRNKSATIPVQIHLVTMDNGYPTQEIIPFSEVTLMPDAVSVSNDATAATNFKFESPVYLQAGVEYAIVVLSNDDSYRMWLSEVGKDDVNTGKLVSKNPYTGVMFKSQNASTWTADQNKDFKFRFNRAKFNTAPRTLDFSTLGITEQTPLEYSQLSVIAENIAIDATNIDFSISHDGGNTYYPIIPTEDIYLSSNVSNRANNSGQIIDNNSIKLRAILSSGSEYVTPIIDLDRVSINSVYNIVNSETDLLNDDSPTPGDSELEAVHGKAAARYITHDVELNNPADQLDVYVNINRPTQGSNVKVYARFKTGEEDIKNVDFIEIKPATSIPITSTRDDFNEVAFVTNDDDGLSDFTGFQIKIVMVSDDHANVPVIEDLRAIATT